MGVLGLLGVHPKGRRCLKSLWNLVEAAVGINLQSVEQAAADADATQSVRHFSVDERFSNSSDEPPFTTVIPSDSQKTSVASRGLRSFGLGSGRLGKVERGETEQ